MQVEARGNQALRAPLTMQRRILAGASLAHLLHDGYTDLLYVLLPVWQTQFGLSYADCAARCRTNVSS
jgi:FSR family fosmidomycin resistance protein-like MFS transporter